MKEKEWPLVLPIVQSVLNHSIHVGLGNRAPINFFSGLLADKTLRLIVPPSSAKPINLNELQVIKAMNVEDLMTTLQEMHRDVAERRNTRREAAVASHNAKTNVMPANFSIGDFVLVARRIENDGHKLRLQWLGPQRIVRIESDWEDEDEDLINETHALVYANRLKFYADSQLFVTQELLNTIDNNQPHYNTIIKLLDLEYDCKETV